MVRQLLLILDNGLLLFFYEHLPFSELEMCHTHNKQIIVFGYYFLMEIFRKKQ